MSKTPARKKLLYQYSPVPQFTDPLRRAKLSHAFPEIRRVLKEYLEAMHIPGIAYGIVIDDELASAEAIGLGQVESNAPATPDSVFRIASMSKSFVAMAILMLRDANKLRIDEHVSKYIPEFKKTSYPTNDSPPLTIRHLLTMSPGFPEDNPWGDRQMAITERKFTEWLRAGIPFSNAPNVTFEYSNYAYAILGRIVSRIAKKPFQKYITQQILKPLGMKATVWDKARVAPEHFAYGYRFEDDQLKREPILADGAYAAMAGLWTTVPDFARYMMFLLDAFPPRDDPDSEIVSRATRREMMHLARFEELVERQTADNPSWRAVSGYGLGLGIWHDEHFGFGVAHGGGLPGYGSYFYLLPDFGVGVAAFANRTYAGIGRTFPQILELLARTGGLQARAIQPAPVLSEMFRVVQCWLESNDESGLVDHVADNFLLDFDMVHRRAQLDKLKQELGSFGSVSALQPLNALRGKWQIECARGVLDVLITLAPTMPPTIQMLTLSGRPNT